MTEERKQLEPAENPEQQEPATMELAKQLPGQSTMWNNVKMMNLAYKTAGMLSRSGLVPDSYRGSPENCLIAIDMANRLGISPLMVMQNLYIVKGKPAWSGSFCAAAINGSGRFTPLRYCWVGEKGKPSFGCYAIATRLADGEKCFSDTVTLQMAMDEGWLSKTGSKWKTMPVQMMLYRAAAFFARAHCSDFLLGLQTVEEVQDVRGYENGDSTTVVTLEPQGKEEHRE